MTFTCWSSHTLAAALVLTTALPAVAQSNLSDITGPNVSDITGTNVSDITGTNAEAQQRAIAAGLTQADLDQLADDIAAENEVCSGGGDCSTLQTLLEQAKSIISDND
ncbi:MAG: hypothetical protein AAGC93_30380 [Cyanobacteria bacterium P01_F01_bin.53]